MGNAIQNLHQLLQMPYGCGEQNMALFAPNIYILDYLNHTGQLTEAVKSKAIGYLVAGKEALGLWRREGASVLLFPGVPWAMYSRTPISTGDQFQALPADAEKHTLH